MNNLTKSSTQSTKTINDEAIKKYRSEASIDKRKALLAKAIDNVVKLDKERSKRARIAQGVRFLVEGSSSGEVSMRRCQNRVACYTLFCGWKGHPAIKDPEERAQVMIARHRQDSEFLLMSDDDREDVEWDCIVKAYWKPKVKHVAPEDNKKIISHQESVDRIQAVYDNYLVTHGAPPSRNKLVELAQCSKRNASRFLKQVEPHCLTRTCEQDLVLEEEFDSSFLADQCGSASLTQEESLETQWTKALESVKVDSLSVLRGAVDALPLTLKEQIEGSAALLDQFTWFLADLRKKRKDLPSKETPLVPPKTCRCRFCGESIFFLTNKNGKNCPVEIAEGIVYSDRFDSSKHMHHLLSCAGVENSLYG